MRFPPALEAEYVRAKLIENRLLIGVACLFATLLIGLRGLEQALGGHWGSRLPVDFGLVFSSSLLLTVLVCSAAFERWFLYCAAVIVPIRNAIIAAKIAHSAAGGEMDLLMALPLLLIGPFFFLGLRFRIALIAGVVTAATFMSYAFFIDLPLPATLRACVLLSTGLVVCAIAACSIEKRSRTSFLETRITAELAQNDSLTGTKNRRIFDEHLARLWPQAVDRSATVALLLIDIDHFKAYNDTYGHQAGDQALRLVARTLQMFIRQPLDLLARYGGEEFVAVFCDVDLEGAKATANRMRHAIEELAIEHRGSPLGKVTISAGVAVVEPTSGRNPRGALQLADQALYEAKIRGRNRVEVMNDIDYKMLVTGIFTKDAARVEARVV
jgi:diguanylate cyclase (GGDEF)-like protein